MSDGDGVGLGSEVAEGQLLWEPDARQCERTHLVGKHLRRTCTPRHVPDAIADYAQTHASDP